jgi:hypothetical protein
MSGTPFIGVSLHWNVQDASQLVREETAPGAEKTGEENLANTREQVNADIEKTLGRPSQAVELISVARKVVDYRREDYRFIRTGSSRKILERLSHAKAP